MRLTKTGMADLPRSFPRHPVFHAGELDAQHRFGVADEAERMSDAVTTRVSIGVRQFVETQPFMFVGTACGGRAPMTCDIVQSLRDANGDLLPVVRVIDTKTLRFMLPAPGDGRIDATACDGSGVGLLFVDFVRGIRYRINGRATLRADLPEAEAAPWPTGSAIVELAVAQAYGNCGTRVVRLKPAG
ncbi:putative pyridoxine 5'-phosphate oxidase superfamily flavin-nucleotide-binding protein [Burkholderia pyrrocinia]|uniref:Putative pyridoxine 5'-phosphate oxidase superfamily flavin-nucleotide-binding protein n=2 Tax=Burkholderiaceae TaxID=119060 RepID=A0A318I2G7_BURPY|nr:putative pyridoxine 5'-phosphate oxidase superfamily flavin-nucleotide-binding protein [Burkholderia pyrrocinia]SFW90160.1 Predicted flavin-nucleotide-binding protein, pyridoxine 5'-phosphate oxidase superfamily [Burkholderia sp. NFACC33-1]SFY46425.1 Predicted flavin-nucleotide-binding protein, pyridoxine 5'-phosphate oxidase superfamily [Burkholderia sp. NFPP32]